jgi:hypothetical protein
MKCHSALCGLIEKTDKKIPEPVFGDYNTVKE